MDLEMFPRQDSKIHLVNALLRPFFVQSTLQQFFEKYKNFWEKHWEKTRSECGNLRTTVRIRVFTDRTSNNQNAGFSKAI